ncbi:MAG: aminotransferase class IV [Solirubrobacterales bacterium]
MTSDFPASVDGVLGSVADATVPASDDGLLRGDGAFEVIRLYAGAPFALADHLDRLAGSAAAIELPWDRQALSNELADVLEQMAGREAQVRIVLTRGGHRIVMAEPLPDRGRTLRLVSVTFRPSSVLDGVKSLSYAANMHCSRIARSRGADEAVLVDPDGTVLEAPTATVFWVTQGGQLRTPTLDLGLLASITRERLESLLDVEQGPFPLSDLRESREAFLASTTREVQPVASVDGEKLSDPDGQTTQQARDAFAQARDEELARS